MLGDKEVVFGSASLGLIVVEPQVLEHLYKYRQVQPDSHEKGGVLVGELRHPHIVVTGASQPGDNDSSSRFSFLRRDNSHKLFVQNRYKESNGTVVYIGEWHTHPERKPTPSNIDLDSWSKNLFSPHGSIVAIIGYEFIWWGVQKNGSILHFSYSHT